MAYDFLGLVNEVLVDFNEVILNSTTFSTAPGFHNLVKYKVNAAIRDIYSAEDNKWPFTRSKFTQVLTVPVAIPYVLEYALDATVAAADWESFYIKRTADYMHSDLAIMDFNQYKREKYISDSNSSTDAFGLPDHVVRLQNNKFTVTPVPKYAYTVEYEGFTLPTDLSAYNDVPTIPAKYRQVILDRALYYCYMFRDNAEEAALAENKFQMGLFDMRRELIPQNPFMVIRD